jgi:hypothetical protein
MTDPEPHKIIADPQAWILLKAPKRFFSTRNLTVRVSGPDPRESAFELLDPDPDLKC